MTSNIETIFEDIVCPKCFTEGMVGNGGDTYICPTCYCEGSIYDDCIFEEDNFKEHNTDEGMVLDKICPECGTPVSCELIIDKDGDRDGDSYRCTACGHEGSIQEDIDASNYYWEEMLCGYPEGEKGEVND